MPIILGALVIAAGIGVSRLAPAAPSVEGSGLWIDVVRRGELVREVRGTGTLVPVDIAWIPATTDGQVQRVLLRPGAVVEPQSVLIELRNPALEQQVLEARLQLEAAAARLRRADADATLALLQQEAALAQAEAALEEAQSDAEADDRLLVDGLVSELQQRRTAARAKAARTQLDTERKRFDLSTRMRPAQLAEQEADVQRLRTVVALREDQLGSLRVRAGMHGVLQAVPVEAGSQVAAGTNVARVANPSDLKAQVRVPETQARDVQIGQVARVDTRNGVVTGQVSRVDPAAVSGTVMVDITLTEPLPRGARPDLSVDGIIEIERITDALYTGRPAAGQELGTLSLFRIGSDAMAERTPVRLGRGSVRAIEIVEGLQEGDRVVLSDMSAWDQVDRVRIR
jgi:HlyD family secretion protein